MLKALKIFAGLLLTAILLEAASWATRDCPSGRYTFDNCLWLWLCARLGLPASKLGRAMALELEGLALLAGLYLTIRYVFPPLRSHGGSRHESGQ